MPVPAASCLLSSVTKHMPLALSTSVQRHSFIEKINLLLILSHQQVIFTSEDVVQVNISTTSGNMCILANHIPSIEPLCPGVLEVIELGNILKKYFANIHPGNCLTINNVVVGAPLKSLSLEAIYANLQEALRAISSDHWSENLKLEAQIKADIYEAF
ncbi:epsilon subunit of F1F0-ATP synthase N-terminal domain-containing protein [Boletus coccyginus]|nr:epsilon subunit of F1F0-ATP synthase N-terminal domain-containing protein [Boletus coccyginus]